MAQIEVIILPNGNVTINGKGFVGAECDEAMAELEKALGTVTDRTDHPEYRMVAEASTTQSQLR